MSRTTTTPTRSPETVDAMALVRDVCQRGWLPTRSGDQWPVYPAGIDLGAAESLHDLAASVGAVRTIETGLGMGISAVALSAAVASTGDECAGHTAIDPAPHWCGHAGLDFVNTSPVAPLFTHIHEPSMLALPRLYMSGERFDFAFIDGAHHFDAALIDIMYTMLMLPAGGLCALDDAQMPAVRLAINYSITNLGVQVADSPHRSLVVLRRPEQFLPKRDWDHFVPFASVGAESMRAGRGCV